VTDTTDPRALIAEGRKHDEAMMPGEWQIAGPWPAVLIVVDHDPSHEPPDEIATMGKLVRKSDWMVEAAEIALGRGAGR